MSRRTGLLPRAKWRGIEMDITADARTEAYHGRGAPHLDHKPSPIGAIVFFCLLAAGIGYGVKGLLEETASVHEPLALGVFALLGLALLIALGFEFVNGFHDTANAVATVIYTHSLPPVVAVGWSGF